MSSIKGKIFSNWYSWLKMTLKLQSVRVFFSNLYQNEDLTTDDLKLIRFFMWFLSVRPLNGNARTLPDLKASMFATCSYSYYCWTCHVQIYEISWQWFWLYNSWPVFFFKSVICPLVAKIINIYISLFKCISRPSSKEYLKLQNFWVNS